MIDRHDGVDEASARWFVRNEAGEEMSEEDLRQWDLWWSDPDNRLKYGQYVELRQLSRTLPAPSLPSTEDLLEDLRSSDDAWTVSPKPNRTGTPASARAPSFWFRRPLPVGVFAAVLVVVVCGVLLHEQLLQWLPAWMQPSREYVTVPGGQRTVLLADGSSVTLGGNSRLSTHFSRGERLLQLDQGEGLFRVAHDAHWPFSVCAAGGCTTAVGTIFDVRVYSKQVKVWVKEGAVNVEPGRLLAVAGNEQPGKQARVRLQLAQQLTYDRFGRSGEVQATDPRTAEAWTSGAFIYRGQPLSDVIEDVRRYTSRPIAIDHAAGEQLFSGSVLEFHLASWLRGLPEIFPIDVVDCHAPTESGSVDALPPECNSNPALIIIRGRSPG